MASKRRNMFYQNKKQETTEIGDAGSGFVGGQLLTEDDQEPQDDYYYYEDDDYSRIVSLLAAKLRENEASSEKHHSPEGYQHKWWSGYVDDYPDETSVAQHK
ncbi:hypothetical protein AAG570_005723 [Ranatra chinensis]|uniref:Uncharacterized protein n=1 Tax=Ranatra chinensis TaxID=642074 RepID=A0ABD0XYL6_9HEMI